MLRIEEGDLEKLEGEADIDAIDPLSFLFRKFSLNADASPVDDGDPLLKAEGFEENVDAREEPGLNLTPSELGEAGGIESDELKSREVCKAAAWGS